jgi:hypothetical protein
MKLQRFRFNPKAVFYDGGSGRLRCSPVGGMNSGSYSVMNNCGAIFRSWWEGKRDLRIWLRQVFGEWFETNNGG